LAERLAANVKQTGPMLVLGNGGAALAAVAACKLAGATRVWVSARSWLSSTARREWRDVSDFEVDGVTPLAWDAEAAPWAQLVCLVQATSAGMRGKAGGEELASWVKWQELPARCFVYDVVYNPARTPLLAAAEQRGLSAEGGLSMLVGQAALAVELWLGVKAPRAAMMRVAEAALAVQAREAEQAR
jgi:shikimate dehydrogenase